MIPKLTFNNQGVSSSSNRELSISNRYDNSINAKEDTIK